MNRTLHKSIDKTNDDWFIYFDERSAQTGQNSNLIFEVRQRSSGEDKRKSDR